VIRPLLGVRHANLVAELERAGLPWREDPSNLDPKFARNRIRHELLPLLAALHGPEVVARLVGIAARARETVEALDRIGARELDRLASREPNALTLSRAGLRALPRLVAVEVLRQAAARLGHRLPLRAWGHRRLERLLSVTPPRRSVRLGGIVVETSGDRVRLGTAPPAALVARTLAAPGTLALPEIGRVLIATLTDPTACVMPSDAAHVVFDADRVSPALTIRARRRGDRFTPWASGERRLKTFLIDAKVPRWDRPRVPIVEAGDEIIWVGGLRRSALAPVTPDTTRVLALALIPLA
jgi:tRNA(Ile)-lysidine synthase